MRSIRQGPILILHAVENAGYAAKVAERAARHHRRIREDLELAGEVEVAILLLTERVPPAVQEAWKKQLPRWLAGAAFPGNQFIVVRVRAGQTPRDLDALVSHELTHVILKADFPRYPTWPVWFQEGLAMRESGGEGLQRFATLALAVLSDRLLPLDSIWTSFPDNEGESRLAYAEGASFLSFLVERHGRERFGRLMEELRREEFERAFTRSYGFGTGAVEREWRAWLRRPYTWVPLATSGTAFWTFITALFFVVLLLRYRKNRRLREQWEKEDEP